MNDAQRKAISEVCYLPEETTTRGPVGHVGWWTWKLTVNAGFE